MYEYMLPHQGPVETFTAQLDLEQPSIRLWGKCRSGNYFYYRIAAQADSQEIHLIQERSQTSEPLTILPVFTQKVGLSPVALERLSLGSHRAQEWEKISNRADLTELLPLLFHLGQMIALSDNSHSSESSLLGICQVLLKERNGSDLETALKDLLKAGMQGLLSPTNEDQYGFGYSLPPLLAPQPPLLLLTQLRSLIRQMFLDFHSDQLDILPCVPPSLHCGRLLGVELPNHIGQVDLEWSKKQIRRMVINVKTDHTITLEPGQRIGRCRLHTMPEGYVTPLENAPFSLILQAGKCYYLDRFEYYTRNHT